MTTIDSGLPARGWIDATLERSAHAVFAATSCLSALLLFMVQPMFTKMVLPMLGGSPAVWSVAMVFFQAALLAGYLYAHLLTRSSSPSRAALLHLVVLVGAAATLPIAVSDRIGSPPATGIEVWTLTLFVLSIGLPFAALSASAPLLQSWFATIDHVKSRNPYILYAASNIGSFAALLTYPLVLEPLLRLRQQAELWSGGFAVLALLIAAAALIVSRRTSGAAAVSIAASTAPSFRQRGRWALLGAIPCGLCIAVTAHITTDIAAAPFLWVLPLALYLSTFVAVFRTRPWFPHDAVLRYLPIVVAPLSIVVLGGDLGFWLLIAGLDLIAFFVVSLACHGELYRQRPAPEHLTDFYLWISIGGLAGGVLAGLLAAHLFNGTHEYPLLIVAALLAQPGVLTKGLNGFFRSAWPALVAAAGLVLLKFTTDLHTPASAQRPFLIALVCLVGLMLWQRHNLARFTGLVVLAFVVTGMWRPGVASIAMTRSFFGVHHVVENADGSYRMLFHGTTLHGAEHVRDRAGQAERGPPEPLAYYYFGGPISEAISAARAVHGLARVAAVGLGVGSLACHKQPSENWTFFEIDPVVERIARDPKLFRFVSECAPDIRVVIGDARLTLARAEELFDVIVLDAFSSDAVPVHLLTREAFAGYKTRLAPHGVIVAHISNRHMELAGVVGAVAKAEGLTAMVKRDDQANDFDKDYRANAIVAVAARDVDAFGDLPRRRGWRPIASNVAPWTDDYSNLLGAIYRRKFEN